MIDRLKGMLLSGAVGTALLLSVGDASAGIIPSLNSIDSENGNFRWTYDVRVTAVQRAEEATYHAVEDFAGVSLAQERLQSIERQLEEFDERLRHLTIRAPCDGTVVAPLRKPEPKLQEARGQLLTWFGTPLDPKNLGCFIEERTHLLTIAPDEHLDAVLLVDQADRDDLTVSRTVQMKFEHLPERVYQGTIRQISWRRVFSSGSFVPAGITEASPRPAFATTSARLPCASTIASRSKWNAVWASRRNRRKASLRFRVDERARAQRWTASSWSARRPI
jgi:hypothetical protein